MRPSGRGRLLVDVGGFVLLVVSLIFVGLEVRQNTTAVRSATEQAIADQTNDINLAMATNPGLSRLVALMYAGETDELTPGEDWQLRTVVLAGLRRVENVFLQVENGVIDEGAFSRIGFGFYAQPFGRTLWTQSRGVFDPAFGEFMDGVMAAGR